MNDKERFERMLELLAEMEELNDQTERCGAWLDAKQWINNLRTSFEIRKEVSIITEDLFPGTQE